jgi:hypothetical protein
MVELEMVAEINNTISVVNKKWSRNIPLLPERVHEFRSLVSSIWDLSGRINQGTPSESMINKFVGLVNNARN